ncbi:Uma2 family endonuclease [soil metagenome]
MSYAMKPDVERLTVDEYLEREALSETKHEYVAGWLYAFAGAKRRHNQVVSRLMRQLLPATDNIECEVFTSDMLVRAAADVFYYPDITVACDPTDDHDRYVTRPCLVVEVLSPSKAHKDQREKLLIYRNIESLQGYLIVSPEDGWIELHERDDSGAWHDRRVCGDDPVLLPCVDVSVEAATLLADATMSS